MSFYQQYFQKQASSPPQPQPKMLRINFFCAGDVSKTNMVFGHLLIRMGTANMLENENVNVLKHRIKEAVAELPRVSPISTRALRLWKVPMTIDDSVYGKTFAELKLNVNDILSSGQLLSDVFTEPLQEMHMHIIALVLDTFDIPSEDDVECLRWDFLYTYKSTDPSIAGIPQVFQQHQSKHDVALNCNRPYNEQAPIPVTLLHPAFGQFIDDCDTYTPTWEDNKLVIELARNIPPTYRESNSLAKTIRHTFRAYGIDLTQSIIEGTAFHTAGDLMCGPHRLVLVEVDQGTGSDGPDPYFKACFDYVESTRGHAAIMPGSVLPCAVMLVSNSHICFVGAAWSDRPNLQLLSTPLPLYFHYSDLRLRVMAARHVGAFRRLTESLLQYYNAIPQPSALRTPLFPYPTHILSLVDGTEQSFKYESKVSDDKAIFFGKLEDCGGNICIKFVQQYSPKTHAFCADMGMAPKLLGFERMPGGWCMVVMERITSDYISYDLLPRLWQYDRTLTPILYKRLRACLDCLHEAGYVHGDIRDVNLLARNSDMKFMLIDYDWAGEIGKARYPMNVNIVDVCRAEDARDGNLITIMHDIQMLDSIFTA